MLCLQGFPLTGCALAGRPARQILQTVRGAAGDAGAYGRARVAAGLHGLQHGGLQQPQACAPLGWSATRCRSSSLRRHATNPSPVCAARYGWDSRPPPAEQLLEVANKASSPELGAAGRGVHRGAPGPGAAVQAGDRAVPRPLDAPSRLPGDRRGVCRRRRARDMGGGVRAGGGARPPTPAQRLAPRAASMPHPAHVLARALVRMLCQGSSCLLGLHGQATCATSPGCHFRKQLRLLGAWSRRRSGARPVCSAGAAPRPHPARQVLAPYSHFDIPVIGQAYQLFRARLMPPFTFEPGAESLETRLFAPEEVPFDQASPPHPLLRMCTLCLRREPPGGLACRGRAASARPLAIHHAALHIDPRSPRLHVCCSVRPRNLPMAVVHMSAYK